MTITYQGQQFQRFQEYIDRQAHQGLEGPDSAPLYAHPVDGWILRTLNSTPVKSVINKALDALVSYTFGYDLAMSIFIDAQTFPDIYDVLVRCSQTLGIPIPHAVTRHDPSLFNAYTAGTDEYAFIHITSTLLEYYTKDEAEFVVGHECGHIASGHMTYHTLAQLLTSAAIQKLGPWAPLVQVVAGPTLLAWSRRAEVTADRAGLLCCGDIAVAERALLRLLTGLANVDRVDMEDYLRRYKDIEEFHGSAKFQELFSTHPMLPKRILALRLFANSEIYYSLSGKPKPDGQRLLGREELNRRVSDIIKP